MTFVKVERALLERLTLAIGWFSQRGYEEPYTLLRGSYEEGNWKDSPGRLFPELSKAGFNSLRNLSWNELVDQSTDAMRSGGDESHLPRLVSVIVELLQHPYGQNVLAGDTLRRLRKAVLLPDELAKVSATAAVELKCGHCGKPFVEGEMATFTGHERVPYFACSRCVNPSYSACAKAGCDGSGEMDYKAIAKAVSKADCGQHNAKPAVEPIPNDIRVGGAPPPMPDPPEWRVVGQEPRVARELRPRRGGLR